ncbi:hypothetical protein [Hymenobacter rubripertinctus]|uniref:DUF4199 domain-containing protein n=1 Tax=Hymenobacter rubripertinctus TaxID=2029981 RepID=A0A418R0S8_9BACT|nr:hypothetical protein [Hymenobacter rubripertinctus]RIY11032.1 hypothetical protein D0T11_08465 [Hymenobacter rubripertinctus]
MKKDLLQTLLTWTLLSTLIYLTVLYTVLYGWIDNETGLFPTDKLLLLPILPGLLMLLVEGVLHTFPIYQHRLDAFRTGDNPVRWFWLVPILSVGMLVFCAGFDFLYCHFVDAGIPHSYAETVAQISLNSGQVPNDAVVRSFAQLPFFAQNIFLNVITIVLGNFLALLVGRSIAKPLAVQLT